MYALIFGLVAGAIMAGSMIYMIHEATHMESTKELYLADTTSLDMLYHGRNIQEYLEEGEQEIIRGFVESGGPADCGLVEFGNKFVSVWEDEECEVTYSKDLVTEYSGGLAVDEAEKYRGIWKVDIFQYKHMFCFALDSDLQFSDYHSEVCFDSPLNESVDGNLRLMETACQNREGDNTCQEGTRIYWTDVNGYNFTYAIRDGCGG